MKESKDFSKDAKNFKILNVILDLIKQNIEEKFYEISKYFLEIPTDMLKLETTQKILINQSKEIEVS